MTVIITGSWSEGPNLGSAHEADNLEIVDKFKCGIVDDSTTNWNIAKKIVLQCILNKKTVHSEYE